MKPLNRISASGRGFTTLPPQFCETYGPRVEELDLSHNAIADLAPLRAFVRLRSLILSHNSLVTSTTQLPRLVTVETLWVNYCQIDNLALFVDRIAKAFPNLRFLSMMGTAACPNFLNGGTRAQYVDYRLFVMTRLPRLECLEDEPVTAEQRAHAAQKYGAPVEKPSLESVLGRKKEKLGKKKASRSQKYAVTTSADSGAAGLEHPYARAVELAIPGQSKNGSEEWTTDDEDQDYWLGYEPSAAAAQAAGRPQ